VFAISELLLGKWVLCPNGQGPGQGGRVFKLIIVATVLLMIAAHCEPLMSNLVAAPQSLANRRLIRLKLFFVQTQE
jgi:hypothetical protein